jgi:hypothetical protein
MSSEETSAQLLHLVFGGQLESLDSTVFRDLSAIDFVGVLHLHRLLDPTLSA